MNANGVGSDETQSHLEFNPRLSLVRRPAARHPGRCDGRRAGCHEGPVSHRPYRSGAVGVVDHHRSVLHRGQRRRIFSVRPGVSGGVEAV